MNVAYYVIFISLILGLNACTEKTPETQSGRYQELKAGFQNPPNDARPKVYWWWINGYVDTTRMKTELQAIKAAGIGGVDLFEIGSPTYADPKNAIPAGPAFMGEASLKDIEFAIREATKQGLAVGLNVASSWNAGGSWTKPEHAAKSLYFSKTQVQGSGTKKINLPFPEISEKTEQGKPRLIEYADNGKPVYYEDVAVLAMPADKTSFLDTTDIIQLTSQFNAETEELEWEAPEGTWDVYRYVCSNSGEPLKVPSPNSMGPIIDHYDSAATRAHFMYFIDKLQPLFGDFSNTTLKNLYLASYEATGAIWTSSLPTTFQELHGYSIEKFIPALFEPEFFEEETAERFQQDFNKTLSHLIINNHYSKAKEICNAYGLQIISESGGPGAPLHNVPVDALKALGALDVPRGEFWNKHHNYAEDSVDVLWLVKEVAAAAHIYKRKIVEEEAFTSFHHWQDGPFDLKPLANRAFGEGMNRAVVHGFTHNPPNTGYPGTVYLAGTHYNDKRVWWTKIKPFNDYLARISYVLQETDFVADVVYYYGDQVPNFVAPKNERFSVGPGYDYEIINTEILLNDLTVENGELALSNGAHFKLLSLGEHTKVNPAILEKLQQLSEAGAIIVGAKPDDALGLSNQPEATQKVKSMAGSLWQASAPQTAEELAKGGVFSVPAINVLENLSVSPDFSYADQSENLLDYVHYQGEGLDFYLVSNTTGEWISQLCTFRQQDKTPEIWDPVSGEILPVSIYQQKEQGIEIPVTLPPFGAYLVVFKAQTNAFHYNQISASGSHPPRLQFTEDGIFMLDEGNFTLEKESSSRSVETQPKTQTIEGGWLVTFPENWGAPDSVEFPSLISWTEADAAGIQYFSGTGTYHKTFQYSTTEGENYDRIFLDLGKISEVGEVWMNEHPLGITWCAPHAFEVKELLQEGENTLTIEIANTWSNRIAGDARMGEKYTNTNIATAYRGTSWEEAPLLESGLLGPVTLQFRQTIREE